MLTEFFHQLWIHVTYAIFALKLRSQEMLFASTAVREHKKSTLAQYCGSQWGIISAPMVTLCPQIRLFVVQSEDTLGPKFSSLVHPDSYSRRASWFPAAFSHK